MNSNNTSLVEQLETLVRNSNPKVLSKYLRKNPTLLHWVESHCGSTLSEKVYNALYPDQHTCKYGNTKKFNSLTQGYRFCGPSNTCDCAKQSVSEKLKNKQKTPEEIQQQNKKRSETNMQRYGVENAGRTNQAIYNHKQFYKNSENVQQAVEKAKQTKYKKWGDENFNNRKQASSTLKSKYNVSNPMQLSWVANKVSCSKKENYTPFSLAKQNFEKFKQSIEERWGVTPQISESEYIGVGSRPAITFKCKKCNYLFNKRFDYGSPPNCKICYPLETDYKSKGELEILEFCKSLGYDVVSGDRSAINPFELDIYIPKLKIAVEYCGLYWHSENSGKKSWNYHYRKYKTCREKGITLYTIYSDEWLNKRNIVENFLRSKLNSSLNKIFARKCKIVEVSRNLAFSFYEQNHVQGSPKRIPISYGLEYNGSLVASMSFKKIGENEYELIRFATNCTVVGGASKLLKYFINKYNPLEISSFSNNRFSNGNMYSILGFTESNPVPPMQEYVYKYESRIHKLGIKKFLKETSDGTEWERAQSLGYDRIWDCGKKKWILYLERKN